MRVWVFPLLPPLSFLAEQHFASKGVEEHTDAEASDAEQDTGRQKEEGLLEGSRDGNCVCVHPRLLARGWRGCR